MNEWSNDEEITTTLGTIELVREEMRTKIIAWLQHHVCRSCEKNYSTVGFNTGIHAGCLGLIEDIALIKEMPDEW